MSRRQDRMHLNLVHKRMLYHNLMLLHQQSVKLRMFLSVCFVYLYDLNMNILTTLAKKVDSLDWSAGNVYLRISLSVFKSKITSAAGVYCFAFPDLNINKTKQKRLLISYLLYVVCVVVLT